MLAFEFKNNFTRNNRDEYYFKGNKIKSINLRYLESNGQNILTTEENLKFPDHFH